MAQSKDKKEEHRSTARQARCINNKHVRKNTESQEARQEE